MELFDLYFEILMKEAGDNISSIELMNIYESLKTAIASQQYLELHNEGKFCGFVTWEIRPNEVRYGKIDLGITNLCIKKNARGTYNLMRLTNYLRTKYPNVATFVWQSRKRNKLIEINQRGKYVEDMAENIQSTR